MRSIAPKSPTSRPTSRPTARSSTTRRHPDRAPAGDGTLDLEIANFGGSAAVRLTDEFSVGVGLSYYDFDRLRRIAVRFGLQPTWPAEGSFFGPPLRTADNVVTTRGHRAGGRRHAFGVNIGVSINPSDTFRIGASYRQGPKFDMVYRRDDFVGDPDVANDSQFNLPDVIAVGVLIKPVPRSTSRSTTAA